MTPKEKAVELVGKMRTNDFADKNIKKSKQCALIAVDELINEASKSITIIRYKGCNLSNYDYWQEVKQEILGL